MSRGVVDVFGSEVARAAGRAVGREIVQRAGGTVGFPSAPGLYAPLAGAFGAAPALPAAPSSSSAPVPVQVAPVEPAVAVRQALTAQVWWLAPAALVALGLLAFKYGSRAIDAVVRPSSGRSWSSSRRVDEDGCIRESGRVYCPVEKG